MSKENYRAGWKAYAFIALATLGGYAALDSIAMHNPKPCYQGKPCCIHPGKDGYQHITEKLRKSGLEYIEETDETIFNEK